MGHSRDCNVVADARLVSDGVDSEAPNGGLQKMIQRQVVVFEDSNFNKAKCQYNQLLSEQLALAADQLERMASTWKAPTTDKPDIDHAIITESDHMGNRQAAVFLNI